MLNNNPELFKEFSGTYENNRKVFGDKEIPTVTIYAKSLSELLRLGEEYDLEYIVIHKDESTPWYSYLDDVYYNEHMYPQLSKVIDTQNAGYEKLSTKVFKINYDA